MRVFSKAAELIQDYLFPIFCFGCAKEGEWLCADCANRIDCAGVACCPVCHRDTPYGLPCPACRAQSSLARMIAVTTYHERWLIGRMIHAFKYNYASACVGVFDKYIQTFLSRHADWLPAIAGIVPVPLHPRRFAERGFNQAEVFSNSVSACLGVPIMPALMRQRYTTQQAGLTRRERIKSMTDAFCVLDPALVKGKSWLLVDDVFTTGSTMQECARTLLAAGARDVSGFTLARG